MKRKPTRKQLKEQKRRIVQAVRRRRGWKPPKGMVIYEDKY